MAARGSNVSSVRDPLLYEEIPMSKDRRKFIIVSVFDFILTTLLWLLSTVTKGDDWPHVFFVEVNLFEPYFLQLSLFDIVIVGFLRMVVLLTCYAVFRLEHWVPVAGTTTITTLFIVVKILFFFKKDHGSLPQYLVILASFIVAWFELWLVPFRVLPRERRDVLIDVEEATRTPRRVGNRLTTDDEFRSALEFSSDSDGEEKPEGDVAGVGHIDRDAAMRTMEQALPEAQNLLNQAPTWKSVNKCPEIRILESGNTYYLRTEIACKPAILFQASWKENHKWNAQLLKSRVILFLDASTEVIHSISAPAMRGYIASRYFVDVRRVDYNSHEDSYTCTYVSVEQPSDSKEPVKGLVRGKNGVNVVRISPAVRSGHSIYEWVMDTDAKVSVPKMVMRSGMKSFLVDY
ncbi:MENTAL domain containing protein, partial [Aphelenchoides avenae]